MNENINKVIYGTSTLIDLTSDTVDPDRMYKGDTAHAADGSVITGTAEVTVDGTTLIMPEGLCDLIGTVDPETHHWIRPEGLPDLDSIYNNETNTLYMTVDATGRIPDPHVSFGVQGAYTVQIGHIQNGEFVADSTESKTSNATFSYAWTPAAGNYPIVKITGTGNITYFNWKTWTSADGHTYEPQYQSVIEWIGHCYNLTGDIRTPYFTEREKIDVDNANNAFLYYRWQYAYSLQDLDVSMWNTSAWNITCLSYTWQQCVSLPYLDVSNWNTSNWVNSGLYATWDSCYKLESLDLHTWNTSKWKVVNSMNVTWSTCGRLKYLDVSTWDTAGWVVTGLNQTWYRCWHLESLDLSHWNTSNWAVTNCGATWCDCHALEELNVSTWDTSGWDIKAMTYTWANCRKLRTLPIGNWNTSNWKVTLMTNTWYCCTSLEDLPIENWDTSGWAVTNITTAFQWLTCLKTLDLSKWDTSGWTFSANAKLQWNWMSNLISIDISSFNLSKLSFRSSSNYFLGNGGYKLQNIIFGASNSGKFTNLTETVWNINTCRMLTRESLLNIFDILADGVSGKTLTIGTVNLNKLTAEEKAIATNKGWTLT